MVREQYSKRTIRRPNANDRPGYDSSPAEGTRHEFAQDDEVFWVWDLKLEGTKDMQIARKISPREISSEQRTGFKDGRKKTRRPTSWRLHQESGNLDNGNPVVSLLILFS